MSTIKRFRPSVESVCSHAHCVEPPSSVPCAHCPLTFCLRHLVEHQTAIDTEHKRQIASIDDYRMRIQTIEPVDNRNELFQRLDVWTKTMLEGVEAMKNEINTAYDQCQRDFELAKSTALNDEEEDLNRKESLNQLKQSLYALESARLELIISSTSPTVRLIKPDFASSLLDIESTDRPDLDRLLIASESIFTLDFDPTDATLFTTSSQYLLIYKSSRSILQLFNNTGQHMADINYDHIHYGDLYQFTWSSHSNGFLLATSKQLLKLNCTTKRIGRHVDIGSGLFKDVCAIGESVLLVHNLGTSLGDVLEHYSNNRLVQRCWKNDLYPDDTNRETMDIFRIRTSAHLVAIDALFTDKILVCDVLHAMQCLFRVDTKQCSVSAICPVYDTQQWLLFLTDAQDDQDESIRRRVFVIDARESDDQRRMREITFTLSDGLLPTNICFFGSNHFLLTYTQNDEEDETTLLECRKINRSF